MHKNDLYPVFVSCPRGLNYVLESELKSFGVLKTKASPGGVTAELDKPLLYRVLLWSRVANRVLLELDSRKADTGDQIYDAAYHIDWPKYFACDASFAVDFSGQNQFVNNTTFGALRVKDAIVDKFRDVLGERPSVSRSEPDIRISARLAKGKINLSIDLSGDSLHKRGYRAATGAAPLKENVAAGLLLQCGWPQRFDSNASFIDPMCGSGTFLIEAAMLATNKAPGLNKQNWGFLKWTGHDERLWSALNASAKDDFERGLDAFKGRISGFDQDAKVVAKAWENIRQSGFEKIIHVEKRDLEGFSLVEQDVPGLLLTNPPYGERLGEVNSLRRLYAVLGEVFERYLLGWRAGVFTGNIELGKSVAWRSHKQYKLFNGAIESQLILFDLKLENRFRDAAGSSNLEHSPANWKISNAQRAEMFANRLKKNLKNIGRWATKAKVSCYRLYDADMPEFSIAVDVYQSEDDALRLHVQEYQAPKSVDEKAARERLSEALKVLSEFDFNGTSICAENISLKVRAVKKGTSQYEKEGAKNETFFIREGRARLEVNLEDYLDTGVFLDHRPIRKWLCDNASGKRFLNLFCYTGAATVQAALGGAKSTLSVDMSKTYLDWLGRNLHANKLSVKENKLQQADCVEWLRANAGKENFDLIFLDPPSFSNSKRMQGVLDIQRDHAELIGQCMSMLSREGALIFSNNLRKFKLDSDLSAHYKVTNITKFSLDKDFERNNHIHQCWKIEHL